MKACQWTRLPCRLAFSRPAFTQTAHCSSVASNKLDTGELSVQEFSNYLAKCLPTAKKPFTVAVAFSGGPDSTCLLHLLKQASALSQRLPFGILALTVDHGLQAASSRMTAQCVELANKIQVEHRVLKIPWGTAPFPACPTGSTGSGSGAIESIAREARYHLMLSTMREEGIDTLLVGHHADDQLETALLRLARGSSVMGAGGMRARRRWGMGFGHGPKSVGWAGQHGLQSFIVRPLLGVPKERLVNTCRAKGLAYVEDPTNAQPDLTERNRIRSWVSGLGAEQDQNSASDSRYTSASRTLLKTADNIGMNFASDNLKSISVTRLRDAVKAVSHYVDEIELRADEELKRCLLPSPISTAVIAQDAYASIADETLRIAMIRRILRFVSPFPWGSPSAEAGGRSDSLKRISNALSSGSDLRKLTAGAGVLWTPVSAGSNGRLMSLSKRDFGGKLAWLASRQPPIRRPSPGSDSIGWPDSENSRMTLDITSELISALRGDPSNGLVEILYDCRFLLRIRPHLLPASAQLALTLTQGCESDGRAAGDAVDSAGKVLVVPHSPYFLPRLLLRQACRGPLGLGLGQHYERSGPDVDDIGNAATQDAELARLLPGGGTAVPRTDEVQTGEDNKQEGRVAGGPFPDHHQGAFQADFIRLLYS